MKETYKWYLKARVEVVTIENKLLVRYNGGSYDKHYMRFVAAFCRIIGFEGKVPSLTSFRKAGATVARERLGDGEMEQVSRQMSHSSHTSEAYYRTKIWGKRSLAAFKHNYC